MSLAKTATNTIAAETRAVSTRRSLFGGAAAVVLGTGITAGVAASAADFAETPDAELIRLCAEFDALERHRQHVGNAAVTMKEDEAADLVWAEVRRQQAPMLTRMCSLPCTTLAQHSGIKTGTGSYPFAFEPGKGGGVTGRLLDMLLTDATRMIGGPLPVLDADLLALRPEFDRLHALMVCYNITNEIPDGDTVCADFDALCNRVAMAPSAIGAQGRAFQAAAAMHNLTYRLSEDALPTDPVWLMLQGIAGDAYQPTDERAR